ncbi:MAG: hypothetical protein EAX95_10110 [Candidatus Thorarchaeota archaeon]|nr:hypothetical protein [Candidatus Thorarchaeota archaeon]
METDLSRHDPNNPGEKQLYDATQEGTGEAVAGGVYNPGVRMPTPAELDNKVEQWWTGPWPRLHSKINYTNEYGQRIKYHLSNDLLGVMIVEEEMEICTNDLDDPVNQDGFYAQVGEVYLQTLIALWATEMVLIVSDIATTIACAALEKFPDKWWLAALLGACWVGSFGVYVGQMVFDVCSNTDQPYIRFWAIVLLGITMLFGVSAADIIKDLGEYIVSGAGGLTEFFLERPTASLSWIFFKFLCTLITFMFAGAVLILTLLGLI